MGQKDKKIIGIDGCFGEGGGQILRTSLSLSCVTGCPVRVHGIRAGRAKPGLKPQHLLSAYSAARITGGSLEGAELGSKELTFTPSAIRPGEYVFDVASARSSAGSTSLVFQTIAPPLSLAGGVSELTVKGGTHVEWSPPFDFLRDVFLSAVLPMGIRADLTNPVAGYYPIGGGEIRAAISPAAHIPLRPLHVIERGELLRISVTSAVSNLPVSIARRQADRAAARLNAFSGYLDLRCIEPPSPGRGAFIFILAEFKNIRAGFSALGAIGKKAETVADEAADRFLGFMDSRGALDPHLSDQVLLFMALAEGESAMTTSEMTKHLITNIYVIEKFLPVRFELYGKPGGPGTIRVKGCGFMPSKS